jgi:hypothetical protein
VASHEANIIEAATIASITLNDRFACFISKEFS